MESAGNVEFAQGSKVVLVASSLKRAGQKWVWQKLYQKGNDSFLGRGGGSNFKIRISLFGSFQRAEFGNKAEKFHPSI